MGRTKFARRSLANLSEELRTQVYPACPTVVAQLLRAQDYSPRINVKRFTGPDHLDRDRQFVNIRDWVDIFEGLGLPIISVDGNTKVLIGNFKNPEATWRQGPRRSTSTTSSPTPGVGPLPRMKSIKG